MKIAIDVSQTCIERTGCACYADTLAKMLADYLNSDNIILYHHFGSWLNQETTAVLICKVVVLRLHI